MCTYITRHETSVGRGASSSRRICFSSFPLTCGRERSSIIRRQTERRRRNSRLPEPGNYSTKTSFSAPPLSLLGWSRHFFPLYVPDSCTNYCDSPPPLMMTECPRVTPRPYLTPTTDVSLNAQNPENPARTYGRNSEERKRFT